MVRIFHIEAGMFLLSFSLNLTLFAVQYVILNSSKDLTTLSANSSYLSENFNNHSLSHHPNQMKSVIDHVQMGTLATNTSNPIMDHSLHAQQNKQVENQIFKTATLWNIAANLAFGLTSFFFAHLLGMMCDKYPVKGILISIHLAHLVPIALLAFTQYYHKPHVSLYLSVVFMAYFGIISGVNGIALICSCYISQIYDKNSLTRRYGFLEACLMLGSSFPNLTGGLILDKLPFFYMPVFAFMLLILSLVYCIYGLSKGRSSVHGSNKSEIILKKEIKYDRVHRINPPNSNGHYEYTKPNISIIQFVRETISIVPRKRSGFKRFSLVIYLSCVLLASIAVMGANGIFYLYLRKSPFYLSNFEVGLFLFINMLFNTISLFFVLPLIKKRFKINELIFCMGSLLVRAVMFLIVALGRSKTLAFSSLPLALLCHMEIPILRAKASDQVDENENGRLMGVFASFQNFGFTISQLCVIKVYDWTLASFSGLALIVSCVLCVCALPLLSSVIYFCKRAESVNYQELASQSTTGSDQPLFQDCS